MNLPVSTLDSCLFVLYLMTLKAQMTLMTLKMTSCLKLVWNMSNTWICALKAHSQVWENFWQLKTF